MKHKVVGTSSLGEDLVECPVCKVPYLRHALNQHLSQIAGKEAQYIMAHLVYEAEEKRRKLITIYKSNVLKKCPHWQYLLDNPKTMPDTRPVMQKERWVRDNRVGSILDKVKALRDV